MGEKRGSNDPNEQDKNDWYIAYSLYGFVGIQLAVSVIAGLALGNYLDKKIGTSPWLSLVGLILGSTAGFYNLIKVVNWHKDRKGS